jgi:tRNA threonylcarbamoyl adenosine modification protein YjeE
MHATINEAASRTRRLRDVGETARLAEILSRHLRRGDVIGLGGNLGLGKTTLARALINALARRTGAPGEEVPSPTFTLVQVYELPGLTVSHFDLYRIDRPEDTRELGLADAIADGVVLIEWPERLGAWLPADRLDVVLGPGAGPDERIAEIAGHGEWAGRIAGILDDDLA